MPALNIRLSVNTWEVQYLMGDFKGFEYKKRSLKSVWYVCEGQWNDGLKPILSMLLLQLKWELLI